MDAIETIMTRRSIRKYTGEPVSDSEVKVLLEAAMAAPTAGNQQPWCFVVVRDRELLGRVPDAHPYSSMVPYCDVAIVVCVDTRPGLKHPRYWQQDAAAATQNILLAAHALGLAGVWMGVYPEEARTRGIAELFGLPDGVEPVSMIPIGRPAEEKPRSERYDAAKVHRDRWER